jgi:signal transduction histidine kinase
MTEVADDSGHCWAAIPLLIGTEAVGALGLRFSGWNEISEGDRQFMVALAHQCAQALERARLFEQVRTGRAQLQTLSRQLMEAQESERRQIARELHDEIGQALTALKINIRSLQRLREAAALTSSLQENLDIIEGVLRQVRDLSLDLRPPMLDDLGLVAALRWYLDRQAKLAGFEARFTTDPLPGRPASYIETTCYRVAQEALTNVVRHAQARQVRVELRRRDGQAELIVRDDGVGFDVQAALQGARHGSSFGVLGMQERVLLAGGRIEIESAPGQGTEVRACFPVELFSTADVPVERRNYPRSTLEEHQP